MLPVKRTFAEACLLVLLAVGLGLGANQLRGAGSLKPLKNYFAKSEPKRAAQEESPASPDVRSQFRQDNAVPKGEGNAAVHESARAEAEPATTDSRARASGTTPDSEHGETKSPAHPEHPYQSITFEEVKALFEDPEIQYGVSVFVDARDDAAYRQGHIPGAVQCFPYRLEKYIYSVLDVIEGARKVIVYCNGGDCEDSIFTCRELNEGWDVPYEKLYLFEGGWKEWTANGMPVAKGAN